MKKIFSILLLCVLLIITSGIIGNAALDASHTPTLNVYLLNQNPDPVVAGSVVDLRFGIQNKGGIDANDVVIEAMPDYPFSILYNQNGDAGTIISVGDILAYQGTTGNDDESLFIAKYSFKVSDNVPTGDYNIKIKYSSADGAELIKIFPISIKNREAAEIIQIDKVVLLPGAESNITFTINNVGTSTLRDLSFNWDNTEDTILPVGSDNTKYVSSIAVGESVSLTYRVIADTNAVSGLYKLNLNLKYYDSNNNSEKSITTKAGVYVGGGTDFDVAYSDTSSGQISFSVANVGANPGASVSVVIPDQIGWTVAGSNTAIIGNLNKGDYTVASFALQKKSSNGGMRNKTADSTASTGGMPSISSNNNGNSQTVLVRIDYTDTLGQRLSVNKDVKVVATVSNSTLTGSGSYGNRAATQSKTSSYYIWAGIGFAFLVALFFVYYYKFRLPAGQTSANTTKVWQKK